MTYKITPEKLAQLLAVARANKAARTGESNDTVLATDSNISSLDNDKSMDTVDVLAPEIVLPTSVVSAEIVYNEKQLAFVETAAKGESCILIGAAGTGKTTCMKGTTQRLIDSGIAGILNAEDHKYLQSGTPGIVVVAFTRRAVANIRRNLSPDMQPNCITIHKLLEYEPVYYEITNDAGETVNTMRFEPARNKYRTLPQSIHTIVIEESSMVSVELFQEIVNALSHSVQFIFLGDIQQLPPVFGSAILGFKMLELPTVELTEVYRQALESPIIRLAHRILSGVSIPLTEYPEWKFESQLTLHPWKKKLSSELALLTLAKYFTTCIDAGAYDIEADVILIPFNKACGTDELNKHIAQHVARKNARPVYEIIAGFKKLYLAVGDKVLYDKEDAIVTDIKPNPKYFGKSPQEHSVTLDYWGHNHGPATGATVVGADVDLDFILSVAGGDDADGERLRIGSHIITLQMQNSEREVTIEKAGDINTLILGYAITVHKSQGSEWRKVFLCLHQSHSTMLQRELLYTAVTRARQELYVICEPESFTKGIESQRIKGNTLAEKAEYFKGKLERDSKEEMQ